MAAGRGVGRPALRMLAIGCCTKFGFGGGFTRDPVRCLRKIQVIDLTIHGRFWASIWVNDHIRTMGKEHTSCRLQCYSLLQDRALGTFATRHAFFVVFLRCPRRNIWKDM